MENCDRSMQAILSYEINYVKSLWKKVSACILYRMDSHIEESGKTTKCMGMVNYRIHRGRSGTKVSLKMACLTDSVLNMHFSREPNDKVKLTRHLWGSIREVGSSTKEGSRMTRNKDQEKCFSRTEFGLAILRMDSLMVMVCGKGRMDRNSEGSGKMGAIGRLRD